MTDRVDKPFSPACERNRDPILHVLRAQFAQRRCALEIGSGTGQHAVHFAAAMPWLEWQCSDRSEHLPGIRAWLDEARLPNTPTPRALDVTDAHWPTSSAPDGRFDAVFSANTLHIMGWDPVQALFAALPGVLAADATLVVYGPFNYGGRYTCDSNRAFDATLRARDQDSGIRGFEAVDALAKGCGMLLSADIAMPANNRCLVWVQGAQ